MQEDYEEYRDDRGGRGGQRGRRGRRGRRCYYEAPGSEHQPAREAEDACLSFYLAINISSELKQIYLCSDCFNRLGHHCNFCENSFQPYGNVILFNGRVYDHECIDKIKDFNFNAGADFILEQHTPPFTKTDDIYLCAYQDRYHSVKLQLARLKEDMAGLIIDHEHYNATRSGYLYRHYPDKDRKIKELVYEINKQYRTKICPNGTHAEARKWYLWLVEKIYRQSSWTNAEQDIYHHAEFLGAGKSTGPWDQPYIVDEFADSLLDGDAYGMSDHLGDHVEYLERLKGLMEHFQP
jgi:hypothetical protein